MFFVVGFVFWVLLIKMVPRLYSEKLHNAVIKVTVFFSGFFLILHFWNIQEMIDSPLLPNYVTRFLWFEWYVYPIVLFCLIQSLWITKISMNKLNLVLLASLIVIFSSLHIFLLPIKVVGLKTMQSLMETGLIHINNWMISLVVFIPLVGVYYFLDKLITKT